MMRIILLFFLPTVIWGSTWIAIKFQLIGVEPSISVAIRFLIASFCAYLWANYKRSPLMLSKAIHLRLAAFGFFNYSLNYILTYFSEKSLTSGLVAIIFSLMIYFNMLGLRCFFNQPLQAKKVLSAAFGGFGIILIFGHEFEKINYSLPVITGILLATLGTFSASAGNLFAVSLQKNKTSIATMNFWGMFYGFLSSTLISIFFYSPNFREQFSQLAIAPTSYWLALLYLSIVGTVIAFSAYMTLIKEFGADRAAYTTVFTPLIALIISTYYESYTWSAVNFLGVMLILFGKWRLIRNN